MTTGPYPVRGVAPTFASYRTLDPVRAAALANAVELCAPDTDSTTAEVLKMAAEFEQYLTGEEANGTS